MGLPEYYNLRYDLAESGLQGLQVMEPGAVQRIYHMAAKTTPGWDSLSVSPFSEDGPAARLCTSLGGQPEQQYIHQTGNFSSGPKTS